MEDFSGCVPEDLLPLSLPDNKLSETSGSAPVPVPSPSLDFNDNEDLPTELSDSSETHDEGMYALPKLISISSYLYVLYHIWSDTRPLPVSVSLTGEVQAFQEDLNGKLYINEVYMFSVDKLYDILFTESQFMREFLEQRRFSG